MSDTIVPTNDGATLREQRAYARLLGDGAEVARLTQEIDQLDRHEEADRAHELDELGAALANARRELIHAQHLADQLGAMGVHMKGAAAIASIDEATSQVQGLLR